MKCLVNILLKKIKKIKKKRHFEIYTFKMSSRKRFFKKDLKKKKQLVTQLQKICCANFKKK